LTETGWGEVFLHLHRVGAPTMKAAHDIVDAVDDNGTASPVIAWIE
jgi:hypothetical protein